MPASQAGIRIWVYVGRVRRRCSRLGGGQACRWVVGEWGWGQYSAYEPDSGYDLVMTRDRTLVSGCLDLCHIWMPHPIICFGI